MFSYLVANSIPSMPSFMLVPVGAERCDITRYVFGLVPFFQPGRTGLFGMLSMGALLD